MITCQVYNSIVYAACSLCIRIHTLHLLIRNFHRPESQQQKNIIRAVKIHLITAILPKIEFISILKFHRSNQINKEREKENTRTHTHTLSLALKWEKAHFIHRTY